MFAKSVDVVVKLIIAQSTVDTGIGTGTDTEHYTNVGIQILLNADCSLQV